MGLSIAYKKIRRNINDYGPVIAAGKGLRYIARPVFEQTMYRVYAIELSGCEVPPVRRPDVAFHVVEPRDRALIGQIAGMEEWLAGLLQEKIDTGGLCVAALDGQRVAGFNLIAFGAVYLPLVKLHRQLQPDEAWSEQITVAREYRKQKLAADIRYYTFSMLQDRGIARLYGAALTNNTASLKLARRVGFREIEDICYRSLLGYKSWQHRKIG